MPTIIQTAMIIGGVLSAMVLAIPFFAIWTYHKRKIEEIKAKQKIDISAETRAALAALREEMEALRDTTTKYDVSFDTALQRLESRVGNVEQRVGGIEREKSVVSISQG